MRSEAEHDHAVQEARSKLPPEAASTFDRMRDAARAEATRIESGQIVRLMADELQSPMPGQMRKRDDFVAIVRLIDIVTANPAIMDLLRKAAPKKAKSGSN